MRLTRKGRLQIDEIIQLTDKSIQELFTESFEEITEILNIIKDQKFDSIINTALSNYVIIRLVSLIETFCKNLARKMIDEYHLQPKGIFEKDEIKISILDLEEIKKNKKITVGRIVSNEINFQNPKEIDSTLSKLFEFKFFGSITERSNQKMFSITRDEIEHFFDWKDFFELFNILHDVIHEMTNAKVDYQKSNRFFANSLLFLSYALSITSNKEKELGKK